MGYDVNRFVGDVDEELICSICSGVLDEPLQAPICEHSFCSACITEWIRRQPTCPVDRHPVTVPQLKPVPRILKNLLARLEIKCDNSIHGCTSIAKLDRLSFHLKECDFNPRKPVTCTEGCGLTVPKDELKDHNCIRELRTLIKSNDKTMDVCKAEIRDCKYQLAEQQRDINALKDLVRTMRASHRRNPRTVTEQIRYDEIVSWTASLPGARVTRWGGMISTPDTALQESIKRSLIESGCPSHIVDELMENAHESQWPSGLLTLETRQMNRRQYEQYICKRIPNKQAVIVMACDNMHMSDDMILEPGLVMIFAHGIE